jgi:hypothetical protein
LGVVVWGKHCRFNRIFSRGSGKKRVLVVVFCGEFVALCVAEVVVEQPYLKLQKMRHYFWIFLFLLRSLSGSLMIHSDQSDIGVVNELGLDIRVTGFQLSIAFRQVHLSVVVQRKGWEW